MIGIILAVIVSIIVPLVLFVYACIRRRYLPFIFGIIAFTVSQVMIRIPLLQYLQSHYTDFTMFSMLYPFIFALLIAFSAGIFEETARYVMMRFFMKQRDFQAGFFFGAGHGGIEAILLLGIPAFTALFAVSGEFSHANFLVGGMERFFAMVLHIGLSIMVLQGVVERKWFYLLFAIVIHGLTDAAVLILPGLVSPEHSLLLIEASVAIIACMMMGYAVYIKRRGILE